MFIFLIIVFRQKLGRIFNACILARKCRPECGHKYNEVSFFLSMVRSDWAVLCCWHILHVSGYTYTLIDGFAYDTRGYFVSCIVCEQ